MKLPYLWIFLASLTLIGACEREEGIRTQITPKGAASSLPDDTSSTAQQTVHWKAPDGWTELPPQEMRFAAFQVSSEHPDVLMTVIPLGPESRDLLANVNRWEQQLGLEPSTKENLEKTARHVDVGAAHVDVVDLTGPQPSDDKPQQRMLAAILPTESQVWFFKLVGPADVVGTQRENFDAFVQSIHLGDAAEGESAGGQETPPVDSTSLPPGHPPMPSGDGGAAVTESPATLPPGHPPMPAPSTQGAAPMQGLDMSPDIEAGLTWTTPQGWRQDPNPRAMRAATFFAGPEDSQAELIVSRLSARSPGSFMDNVNRWRGQLGLPAVNDANAIQTVDVPVGEATARVVEIVNEQRGLTMRVAIATHEQDLWFFKLTGPSATVNDQKDEFDAFLKSVQFSH